MTAWPWPLLGGIAHTELNKIFRSLKPGRKGYWYSMLQKHVLAEIFIYTTCLSCSGGEVTIALEKNGSEIQLVICKFHNDSEAAQDVYHYIANIVITKFDCINNSLVRIRFAFEFEYILANEVPHL